MAHIKNLHLNILRNVLAYFYHGVLKDCNLQEFRQLLPPAAVCRVWRECMLPYVYFRAHLEYYIKETDEDNETALPEYEWKSNIDLIVSQRLSGTIRQLYIESYEYPLNFTDMAHTLDTFGFNSSHWRSVNRLYISTDHGGVVVNDSAPNSNEDEALAAQLTDYFGRHLPNIRDLTIHIRPQSNSTQLLSNKLVNMYIRQLHALECSVPITFSCHSFSSKLWCLYVGIASGVTNRLPQLLASPLEILNLFDIPRNFAWWTFIGIRSDHIEFTNLRTLRLQFRQPSENAEEPNISNMQVSTGTVSLNIGRRKLFFPKLSDLCIYDSPYNDGALYSMFVNSPLQTIDIGSSFKSVQHMDTRILFNAADVCFMTHSISPDDYNDYVEFYCKLLGTPSNARTAWLGAHGSNVPLPIPSTVEWVNLKHLIIGDNIHLPSVIQVISQLPKLHTLGIENIVDEVNEAGTNLQAILRGTLTQVQSIATSVKRIWIYSLPTRIGKARYFPSSIPLVFSMDIMCYLTVLIQTLDEVVVPDLYVSDIREFAVRYASLFPHLHDIKVLCASEEDD